MSSHRGEYSDYYRFDLGIRWKASESLSFTAWGLNLLDPQTLEFQDSQTPAAEIPRSFYIQLEYTF